MSLPPGSDLPIEEKQRFHTIATVDDKGRPTGDIELEDPISMVSRFLIQKFRTQFGCQVFAGANAFAKAINADPNDPLEKGKTVVGKSTADVHLPALILQQPTLIPATQHGENAEFFYQVVDIYETGVRKVIRYKTLACNNLQYEVFTVRQSVIESNADIAIWALFFRQNEWLQINGQNFRTKNIFPLSGQNMIYGIDFRDFAVTRGVLEVERVPIVDPYSKEESAVDLSGGIHISLQAMKCS